MLGFGAVSSRSIAGSPFSLISVSAALVASGALLTFGGTTNPGITIPASASGAIVTLGGTATPIWLQAATTSGTFLSLGGTANLYLLGKPIVIRAIHQSYAVRAQPDRYSAKAMSQSFTARGR